MEKITFQDGTKVSSAKVTIDGTDYVVTPAVFSGATPFSSYIMNLMQTNIENAINKNKGNIGGEDYDDTQTYAVGDIVLYEDVLYICTTAVTTAEEFDSTKWATITVMEMIENKQSLPTGGTTGQVLAKSSNADYAVGWVNQSGGGGGASNDLIIVSDDEQDITANTKLFIDSEELDNLGSEVVNSLSGSETAKAPSVNAVKSNCVLNSNIAVIYTTITTPAANSGDLSGTATINYPTGFNKNNTIVLSLLGNNPSLKTSYSTYCTTDSLGYISGAGGLRAILADDNITLQRTKSDDVEPSSTNNIKITLMKIV